MNVIVTLSVLICTLVNLSQIVNSTDLVDQPVMHFKSSSGHEVNVAWKKRDLTVLNDEMPGSVTNIGNVHSVADSGPALKGPSGILVHNGKVNSQLNYSFDNRKRRFIEQHIGTVVKQTNISKRDLASKNNDTTIVQDKSKPSNQTEGLYKSKRFTEKVGTVGQQINVDMEARKKRTLTVYNGINPTEV